MWLQKWSLSCLLYVFDDDFGRVVYSRCIYNYQTWSSHKHQKHRKQKVKMCQTPPLVIQRRLNARCVCWSQHGTWLRIQKNHEAECGVAAGLLSAHRWWVGLVSVCLFSHLTSCASTQTSCVRWDKSYQDWKPLLRIYVECSCYEAEAALRGAAALCPLPVT